MYLHKGLQLPSGTWSTAVLLDQALTVFIFISRVYAYKKGQHKRPCMHAGLLFYNYACAYTYDVGPTRTGVCLAYTLRSYEASIHL